MVLKSMTQIRKVEAGEVNQDKNIYTVIICTYTHICEENFCMSPPKIVKWPELGSREKYLSQILCPGTFNGEAP